MQLVAVLMISTPTSEDTKTTSPGYEEVGASASLRPGQMVRTREFWILWVTFLLNMQSIGYITSMYKVATILLCNVICMISMHQVYGQTFIQDDHFLAMVGTVAAIFNAGGRVVWGQLCDSFGYKVCMVTVTVLCTVLALYCTVPGVHGDGDGADHGAAGLAAPHPAPAPPPVRRVGVGALRLHLRLLHTAAHRDSTGTA